MEILVCVKQVPDDSVKIGLNASGAPAVDGVTMVANAFDTYALEMATRLKEANEGTITVVSIGSEKAKDALKSCLAVGASKAYLVSEDGLGEMDSLTTGYVLSKAVAKIEELNGSKFDIVFCGKETTDCTTGMVGAELADRLGVGCVAGIIDIELKDGGISTKQETEEGYNTVETAIPAVVTVNKPEYDPRYPTMKSKMAARKIPIETLTGADLGLEADKLVPAVKVTGLSEPPKKQAGVKINEKTLEETMAKAMEILKEAKVF